MLHRQAFKFPLVMTISGTLFIIGLFMVAPTFAAPSVTWSSPSLTQTILPGKSESTSVSFTASKTLHDLEIRVVPELAPYIVVSPASFSEVDAGQTVTVNLIVSAPPNAFPGTVDGTIQLRSSVKPNGNVARPLPAKIEIAWQSFTGDDSLPGVAFQYTTFGTEGKVSTEEVAPGTTYTTVEILDPDTEEYWPQYAINFQSNDSGRSVLEWYGENVDTLGVVLSGGVYELNTLSNGVQVFWLTPDVPPEHLEANGPEPEIYAISPSGHLIIAVQTIQGNRLGSLGVSPGDRFNSYISILESMSFE